MAGYRLLLAVFAFCLLHQTNCQISSRLTISPNPLELTPAQASGDGAPVTVQCQPPASNKDFIHSMKIHRTNPGSNKTVLVTTDPTTPPPDNWNFTARLVVTSPGFSARGGRNDKSIMLTMANAKCDDSAEYECEVSVANVGTHVKASNLTMDVKPGNITLTAHPVENHWLVNDTLMITCNGTVGSVTDKSEIEWVWEYQQRPDFPTTFANWKKYTDYYSADDIETEELRDDTCYKNQTSKLVRRLQLEDTNREFRCYVIRSNVRYEQFAETAFVGTVSESVPSTTTEVTTAGVPLGAVIGGTVAAVVVITVVVVVVLCIVIRRKRREEDTGKDRDEDRDFEMHENSAYVSAGSVDLDTFPHQPPFRPSGVAAGIPSNNAAFTTTSHKGRPTRSSATANHNTDNGYDFYTIKDEGDETIDPGYTSVSLSGATRPSRGGGGRHGARHAADDGMVNEGYSAVGDTINKKAPKAPGNRGRARASDVGGGDMYAKVDKSFQRRELQPSASGVGDACDYAGPQKPARRRPVAPEDDVRAELAGLPSRTAPGDDAFSEDYSHLNLAHTGRNGAPPVAPPPAASQPISHSDVSSFDDYAHLDHGLREREDGPTTSPPAPEGRVYRHPPKPKPAVKPKPVISLPPRRSVVL